MVETTQQAEQTIKILLVDDHPAFLAGLTLMFQQLHPGIEVLQASSAMDAKLVIEKTFDLDCVFLDYQLPEQNGIAFLQQLKQLKNLVPVIIISGDQDISLIHQAMDNGAMGFMPKSSDQTLYKECLSSIRKGLSYLLPESKKELAYYRSVILQEKKHIAQQVKPRQLEILVLLEKGYSNTEIGQSLGISISTVKSHMSTIMSIFNASNRTECVSEARRLGLLGQQQA